MALGDGEEVGGVDRVPATQGLEQAGLLGVDRGGEQDVGAGLPHPDHGVLDGVP